MPWYASNTNALTLFVMYCENTNANATPATRNRWCLDARELNRVYSTAHITHSEDPSDSPRKLREPRNIVKKPFRAAEASITGDGNPTLTIRPSCVMRGICETFFHYLVLRLPSGGVSPEAMTRPLTHAPARPHGRRPWIRAPAVERSCSIMDGER